MSFHIKDALSHEYQIQTIILLVHLPEIQYFSSTVFLSSFKLFFASAQKAGFTGLCKT